MHPAMTIHVSLIDTQDRSFHPPSPKVEVLVKMILNIRKLIGRRITHVNSALEIRCRPPDIIESPGHVANDAKMFLQLNTADELPIH
jgi:hypothetical protein